MTVTVAWETKTMSNETVTYKGRKYRQVWRGKTKFGERCKLSFLDGSKEFWVPASAVSAASTSYVGTTGNPRRSSRGRRTGCACGSIEGEYHPWYCASCRFDELDM